VSRTTTANQARHWGRHAADYETYFLDPFAPGVHNPILDAIASAPDPERKTVIDLGCGTGPLLSQLVGRFGNVVALDFSKRMVELARERLGAEAECVTFLVRPMDQLDEFAGRIDLAVSINSLVMPDVVQIHRALEAIHRALTPDGQLFGIVPAIDAIQYQTMLLYDRARDLGRDDETATREATRAAEHHLYDFAFGRFAYRGLRQKFWQSFEIEHRLHKAGFREVRLEKVLYPWDENLPFGDQFTDCPRSWDWGFLARR